MVHPILQQKSQLLGQLHLTPAQLISQKNAMQWEMCIVARFSLLAKCVLCVVCWGWFSLSYQFKLHCLQFSETCVLCEDGFAYQFKATLFAPPCNTERYVCGLLRFSLSERAALFAFSSMQYSQICVIHCNTLCIVWGWFSLSEQAALFAPPCMQRRWLCGADQGTGQRTPLEYQICVESILLGLVVSVAHCVQLHLLKPSWENTMQCRQSSKFFLQTRIRSAILNFNPLEYQQFFLPLRCIYVKDVDLRPNAMMYHWYTKNPSIKFSPNEDPIWIY